jgi:hypothetical protein
MGTCLEMGAEPAASMATRLVHGNVPRDPPADAGGGARGGPSEEGRSGRKRTGPVPSVSWAPDARHCFSGSLNGYVHLWFGDAFNFDTVTTITGVRASWQWKTAAFRRCRISHSSPPHAGSHFWSRMRSPGSGACLGGARVT